MDPLRWISGSAPTARDSCAGIASAASLAMGLALSICTTARAQGADPSSPKQAPSVLTADTLTYNSNNQLITATGDVEISTGSRRLLADQVRYDQRTGKMFANGNVVLIEPNGDAIFGDEVEVTGDLREGFAQAVGMLRKDNSRIAAAQATRREGNVLVLDHAVYSPCPLCSSGKGGPLWQINARRVVLDDQAETVTYRDAWMELFGVPVAYTPWLGRQHPGSSANPGSSRLPSAARPSWGSWCRCPTTMSWTRVQISPSRRSSPRTEAPC